MDDKEKRQLEFAIEKMKSGRPDETIGILEPLAEKGDATALFWLGFRHLHTMRVPDNDPKTKRRFQWVRRDEKKALELIGMSAEKGYPRALWWMGRAYHHGRLVQKDDAKAFLFFQKAAEKGYKPALYWLSECHRNAWGTPKDNLTAFRLCKQAAETGFEAAEFMLSQYYSCGLVMNRDLPETEKEKQERKELFIYWCRRAAEKGHLVAQYMLGRYYLEEKNDKEQALMWLSKSAKHLTNAQRLLEKINKEETKS